jgi:hypothetical protein
MQNEEVGAGSRPQGGAAGEHRWLGRAGQLGLPLGQPLFAELYGRAVTADCNLSQRQRLRPVHSQRADGLLPTA